MRIVALSLVLAAASASANPAALEVSSTAFANGGAIPREHTCDGIDVSPPLAWSRPPIGTKSLAILVQDEDAQRGGHVQWLVTGIPAAVTELGAGSALPPRAMAGRNDDDIVGWSGPCPREGWHRYVFTVYALDIAIARRLGKQDFVRAIAGHVLAQGQLVGAYLRPPGVSSDAIADRLR
ncbi:MAG TPA: YbhB/YbcL family Raf kinase inhibitor-like protein [Kofleriaceae bacterium]|nr:YbhB/YbcL family Raf kinase inhibitor-like protein [Kofleriaceae bacterium]